MAGDAPALTLRDHLREAVLARSPYRRESVTFDELAKRRAAWIDQYRQVYVGTVSITVPALKLKLIRYDEWPVTSGEMARQYLRQVYDGVPAIGASPRARGFRWSPPIVARPTRHGVFAYVDIESAFWQLISCFRPDDLILGGTIAEGTAEWWTTDGVAADRRLRHCIHGSVFSHHLTFYRFGTPVTIGVTSKWSNPTLQLHCMQVLHALCAAVDRRFSLQAWLTDAAIVHADDAEAVVEMLARDWRVASKVKAAGAGAVVNATSFAVGEKSSLDVRNGRTDPLSAEPSTVSTLKRVPFRQLQRMRLEALA